MTDHEIETDNDIAGEVLENLRTPAAFFRTEGDHEPCYDDLKRDTHRNLIRGMALAFAAVRRLDFDDFRDEAGTGSVTLEKIVDEIREDTREMLLEEIRLKMETTLEDFLDNETEDKQ